MFFFLLCCCCVWRRRGRRGPRAPRGMAGGGRAPRRACFATGAETACPVACARHRLCACACRCCRVWQRRCISSAARMFALRRRRRGACNWHDPIFGCISPTHPRNAWFRIGVTSMRCSALFRRHTLLLGSHGCEMVLSGDKNYVVTDGIGPPRVGLFGGVSSLCEVVCTY